MNHGGSILLKIKDLKVSVNNKIILKGVTMHVNRGEIVLLLGPNGSGKSTLAQAILGNPNIKIIGGKIYFDNKDITNTSMEERVSLGITSSFQIPPKLKGIKLRELALEILSRRRVPDPEEKLEIYASLLNLEEHLNRDVNVGFSGGEMRRAELLLLMAQSPRLVILDEIDSGVDLESILILGEAINKMLLSGTEGAIIITHTGFIAKYVKASRAYILLDGKTMCHGPAETVVKHIYEHGFARCKKCEGLTHE